MHSLLDSTSSDPGDGAVEYSTRVVLLNNVDASVVLPYILAVLKGVGLGVAQVVEGIGSHGGILLTTPVGIAHFLDSTIKTTLDSASLAKFGHAVFYPPAVIVQAGSEAAGASAATVEIQKAICRLDLIPPDMKCEWVQIDDKRAAILVSGPSSRKDKFKNDVLPSLTALVHSLEKTGFPTH